MADIQIRQLKIKDRKTVSEMIKKLSDKLGDSSILNCIVPPEAVAKENTLEKSNFFSSAGVKLLRLMFDTIEQDIVAWFASLINKTEKEYWEMPLDTEARIIEQLTNSKEVNDFFTHASQGFRRMRGFVKK